MHLSDLHIGKRVNNYSMIEDQRYILDQILGIIEKQGTEGVIIAGDVYDKSVPSAEAVNLLDYFLEKLVELNQAVYLSAGNHDSAERLAFGGNLMKKNDVHISPVYNGEVTKITPENGVNIFLLPFIKPQIVKPFFPDEEIRDHNKAVELALSKAEVVPGEKNILVAHQFVTGASESGSEELSVGGLDDIKSSLFDAFDYVALGHIHGPQKISRETIRYCGTPLKYSFSEANHEKSVTIVEIDKEIKLSMIPLKPRLDMRVIRGSFEEVMSEKSLDYVHIELTDEVEIMNALSKLRENYKNLMKMSYDNTRTQKSVNIEGAMAVDKKSPLELFSELYEQQNNQDMTEEQKKFITESIERIWG